MIKVPNKIVTGKLDTFLVLTWSQWGKTDPSVRVVSLGMLDKKFGLARDWRTGKGSVSRAMRPILPKYVLVLGSGLASQHNTPHHIHDTISSGAVKGCCRFRHVVLRRRFGGQSLAGWPGGKRVECEGEKSPPKACFRWHRASVAGLETTFVATATCRTDPLLAQSLAVAIGCVVLVVQGRRSGSDLAGLGGQG